MSDPSASEVSSCGVLSIHDFRIFLICFWCGNLLQYNLPSACFATSNMPHIGHIFQLSRDCFNSNIRLARHLGPRHMRIYPYGSENDFLQSVFALGDILRDILRDIVPGAFLCPSMVSFDGSTTPNGSVSKGFLKRLILNEGPKSFSSGSLSP